MEITKVNVLITGSRDWDDYKKMEKRMKELSTYLSTIFIDTDDMKHTFTLIHGDCRGADKLGASIAKKVLGWETIACPPEWQIVKNGKTITDRSAGFKRNQSMLTGHKPYAVIAFIRNNSRGTLHTINLSKNTKSVNVLHIVKYETDTVEISFPSKNLLSSAVSTLSASPIMPFLKKQKTTETKKEQEQEQTTEIVTSS